MRKIVFACAVCAVIGLLAASCAKNEDESNETLRERSFEAWIQLYAPNAEKLDGGIYVEKLKSSEQPGALTPADVDTWVMINYTGRTMASGDVVVTRDPEIAKYQGTFNYYTHYTPDYVPFTPYNSIYYGSDLNLIVGNYLALGHMKEGDQWRVYIPSDLAYGSSGYSYEYSGFGGQNALGANITVVMDLELVRVVTDPEKNEASLVQNYAVGQLNMKLTDTVRTNLYLKPISFGKDTATIKKDSTVSIYYVGRFLDGFVFDTNIEDTAKKYNLAQYASSGKYEPLSVDVGASEEEETTSTNVVVVGMDAALAKMVYGETATMVFTSTYGYGSSGQFPSFTANSSTGSVDRGTIIPPYTPLVFEVTVAPQYGDGSLLFPYTTYAVQHLLDDEVDGVWVTGYVNGVVDGSDYKQWIDTLTNITEAGIKDNLMLGNTNGSGTKPEDCFPVMLPEGKVRDALNIPDNQGTVFRQKIKVFGNIRKYKGTRGLVEVTDYRK